MKTAQTVFKHFSKRIIIMNGIKRSLQDASLKEIQRWQGKLPGIKKKYHITKLRDRDHYKKFL